jgi:lipopolysaccharide export system protein LptA
MTATIIRILCGLGVALMLLEPQAGIAQSRRASTERHAAPARHTTANNVPNPLQGFSQNRDEPIHIDAATLEVRDKDQKATFTGDVHVVQGDTDLHCDKLVVYYEQDKGGKTVGAKAAAKTSLPNGSQQIRRLEVTGHVIVTQKDQSATGDSGEFDMRTNTVTLIGNVIVSHGQNVLRGDRLIVDMTSGMSRMESNSGRVQGLFIPSKQNNASSSSAPPGLVPMH